MISISQTNKPTNCNEHSYKADFHSLETFEISKLNKKALGASSFGIKSNSYHLFGVNMTNISCGY